MAAGAATLDAVAGMTTAAVPLYAEVDGMTAMLPELSVTLPDGRTGWFQRSRTDCLYRAGPTATSIRAVDPRSGGVRVLRDCPLLPPGHTDRAVSAPRGRTQISDVARSTPLRRLLRRRQAAHLAGLRGLCV
jgi:hypothetical protein